MHRVDSTDPHNYDIVLDSNSLGLQIAAEVIVRAVEAGQATREVAPAVPTLATSPAIELPPTHTEPSDPAA
jgi:cytidylate kinase